jgi:hypothetical protein
MMEALVASYAFLSSPAFAKAATAASHIAA